MRIHLERNLEVAIGEAPSKFVELREQRQSFCSGRAFVGGLYLAHLLRALDVAKPGPDLRVYRPKAQRRRIVRHGQFELVAPFRRARIYREEIAAMPSQ